MRRSKRTRTSFVSRPCGEGWVYRHDLSECPPVGVQDIDDTKPGFPWIIGCDGTRRVSSHQARRGADGGIDILPIVDERFQGFNTSGSISIRIELVAHTSLQRPGDLELGGAGDHVSAWNSPLC